jgi:hypothetical protein
MLNVMLCSMGPQLVSSTVLIHRLGEAQGRGDSDGSSAHPRLWTPASAEE